MVDPFVPADFAVPLSLEIGGLHLEPLGPEHNERDHAAWMSNIDYIHTLPGFRPGEWEWPTEMTLERNLDDLERHARDFEERVGFTYSVLDGDDVVGCAYIYPSEEPRIDADIRSWVIESHSASDVAVWEAISAWLDNAWPFNTRRYASRR